MVKEVFRRLLVAFDGSPTAAKALDYAIRIAKSSDAKLTIVSVLDPSKLGVTADVADRFSPFYADSPAPIDVTERFCFSCSEKYADFMETDSFKAVQANLDEAVKVASRRHLKAESEALIGPVAEVIVDYAEENKVDLIILGSRGLSGFKRMLMGHVSSDVAEKAHCPVLIVR
jgi:nucleotide-binding universal stress UspA family protein